jgi:chromosome partitioning protein
VSRDQDTPFVAKANPSDIGKAISLARNEGFTLAILDCPPHMTAGEAQLVATADCLQRPLRSRFRQRLKLGVRLQKFTAMTS